MVSRDLLGQHKDPEKHLTADTQIRSRCLRRHGSFSLVESARRGHAVMEGKARSVRNLAASTLAYLSQYKDQHEIVQTIKTISVALGDHPRTYGTAGFEIEERLGGARHTGLHETSTVRRGRARRPDITL